MFRFYLFGFPVTVELWFWVSCFLLFGGLQMQSWTDVASLAEVAIWIILAFLSILAHELGHASMARRYSATPEILLHAFGGVTVPHGARFNRKQDLLFVGAGPGASLALVALAWFALNVVPIQNADWDNAFRRLFGLNLTWAIFNLLPILPLDGGQLLRTALGDRRLRITATVGFVTAVLVAILGLLSHSVLLTLFMAMFAYENWRLRETTR